MKKCIKTIEAVEAYNILGSAKYQKMNDEGKIKVWKISRKLKPIATQYEDDLNDAKLKMVPTEDFMTRLRDALIYELSKKDENLEGISESTKMTEEDYQSFLKEFIEYNNLVNKTLSELAEKDIELEFDSLTEDDFGKLMSSNDWDLKQVEKIEFITE